jgi:hypothetical protein
VILSLGMLLVVPLGLANQSTVGGATQRWLLPAVVAAAFFSSASFLTESRFAAALLVLPWVLTGLFLAAKTLLKLGPGSGRSLADWAFFIARFNLFLASLWLVASRLGYSPLGFGEPIVLLTATHFTFSGFGVATVAGITLKEVQERPLFEVRWMRHLTIFLLALPYAVATGFVISPRLKLCAAGMLALSVLTLCGVQATLSAQVSDRWARALLRGSSVCGIAAMLLVLPYALGDFLQSSWLSIPIMIRTHGILNGPGFLVLALLGWSLEPTSAVTKEETS